MWPILFTLGPIELRTASVISVLGLFLSAFVFWRKGREEYYDEAELFDGFLLSVLVGTIAARLGFVLLHIYEFGRSFWLWFDVVSRPGMDLLIGGVAATLYLYRYARQQKWDAFEVLDFWSLTLSFGVGMFWLGMLAGGNGFGYPTNLPWGIVFPTVYEKHHPTQLYAALLYFGLFYYLSKVEYVYRTFEWYKAKRKSAQSGFLISSFVIAYGLSLCVLSWLRPAQYMLGEWQLDIFVGLLLMLVGGGLMFSRSGRSFWQGWRGN